MEQLSLSAIEHGLIGIPLDLEVSDIVLAQLRTNLAEAEETLDLARTNAMLQAPDGKNESERKLNRDRAIANDADCKAAKDAVRAVQFSIAEAEANNSKLRRDFAGHCHIAELRAAQMILQSKGTMKHD